MQLLFAHGWKLSWMKEERKGSHYSILYMGSRSLVSFLSSSKFVGGQEGLSMAQTKAVMTTDEEKVISITIRPQHATGDIGLNQCCLAFDPLNYTVNNDINLLTVFYVYSK